MGKNRNMMTYDRSSRPLTLFIMNNKLKHKRTIASKLAEATHHSSKQAFKQVPYFQKIFQNDSNKAQLIAEQLDLTEEEIRWLKT